ncbi:VWA domain-containing protein [Zooshikella marina]|uniref:VWA domain-containing protein n=1 Tax=Zooshikella ganghwensis TaxID=202772 RepID=UPI001BAFEA5A|nr:VWA domain-containing protein [Zooshikella ganghwensis]MBU2707409.1 VWA domain-containing protein [Zooshikella ganghwensis]
MKKLLCTPLLFLSLSVIADDTEIFTYTAETPDDESKSNVLFMLDNSGSMRGSRLTQLKTATTNIINKQKNGSVNVGLMIFNHSSGGKIYKPVKELTASYKTELVNAVNALNATTWTPLSETLYEAYLYYNGKKPEFGGSYTGVSGVLNSSGNYVSPIKHKGVCGVSNSIILFTDGAPTQDNEANDEIEKLIKPIPDSDYPAKKTGLNKLAKKCSKGSCLDELGWYLGRQDNSSSVDGVQKIPVHTIAAFGITETSNEGRLLKSTAEYSEGTFALASSTSEIEAAFSSALVSIKEETSTFVTPSVSLDYFNPLQHNNEQYYVMFKASKNADWGGNLKKYKLVNGILTDQTFTGDESSVTAANSILVDGKIKDTARSFWTSTSGDPDGNDVTKGGMISVLPASRTLYTNVTTAEINVSANKIVADNSNLVSQFGPGIDTIDQVNEVVNWLNTSKKIGDPLHTNPTVITYFTEETTTGSTTIKNYDSTVFFGTNQGFLHAVDTKTGIEKFAFIPSKHLKNIVAYKNATSGKVYGLDGPITPWVNDGNGNGKIVNTINGNTADTDSSTSPATTDFAYLYVGERRGGRSYYALDVTNRSAPTLKWTISGGGTTGDFSELGQTWSKPSLAKVKLNGVVKDVLFFAGGYDPANDVGDPATHKLNNVDSAGALTSKSSMGRAIYMVDAKTGDRLWWASSTATATNGLQLSEMKYSIPADLTAFDIDGDQLADRIFVVDIAGQLWRFDLNHENSGVSDFATGGIIAKFSGDDSPNSRHFFNAPSVALMRERGQKEYLAIAVGSGVRSNPLNEVIQDKFFLIKDYNVYSPPPASSSGSSTSPDYSYVGSEVIKESNLYDATANNVAALVSSYEGLSDSDKADSSNTTVQKYNSLSKYGWYINVHDLNDTADIKGEKVLAKASITSGVIFFTTYQPNVVVPSNPCEPTTGKARMYAISIKDAATPASLISDPTQRSKRHIVLSTTGIPGRPAVLQQPGGTSGGSSGGIVKRVCGGPGECLTPPSENPLQKVFWRENLEDAGTSSSSSTGGTPTTTP